MCGNFYLLTTHKKKGSNSLEATNYHSQQIYPLGTTASSLFCGRGVVITIHKALNYNTTKKKNKKKAWPHGRSPNVFTTNVHFACLIFKTSHP